MKKIMSVVAALLLCVGANAQIVSSSSRSLKVERTPSTTIKYLRAGANFMSFSGSDAEEVNGKLGYDVAFGFQKPFASVDGLYWGMEFGLGSRGYATDGFLAFDPYSGSSHYVEDEAKYMAHNVRISPFTFGYKFALSDAVKLDVHLGAFASFDYTGKAKFGSYDSVDLGDWEDWNRFDAGMQVGAGVWYNRFNIDFTYHYGFIECQEDTKAYTSNFMLRLGIAF